MRRDIEFTAGGSALRGWLYAPDVASGPAPAVVLAHGFSGVKEMYLDRFAEVFAAAGLACLVFDNRNFGASDGAPRQEIDPWIQVRDYRDAITFARTLPEIDSGRIGVWGTSYSGGHALVLGAIDRRVSCVVAQVPLISGFRNVLRLVRSDMIAGLRGMCEQDREARFEGSPPSLIPVVSSDPAGPAALPTADAWAFFTETAEMAPAWRNEVTLRSMEMLMEYEPVIYIPRVSPTPLLIIVARADHLTVADETFAAFNSALEPKKLVILEGGHFDAYVGEFERASGAARDWFVQHLSAETASRLSPAVRELAPV